MGATGYIIHGAGGGNGEEQKQVIVSPADSTIEVERVESDTEIDFKVKTTFDGLETIHCGSGSAHGYFRAIHVKFNHTDRRYRLVCILNGSSYAPCRKDFAFYLIKMAYKTGGDDPNHAYIAKYSRSNNDGYIALEKIADDEYNILIHTSRDWCWNNFGIMKEDKEEDVLIEHFNMNTTAHTVTGTIVPTDVPAWENGAPAEWQVIPNIPNPQAGMLGHYYASDRNLYFYDGYNWHNVYSLAQGVAMVLATADAPATANDGTIYYDTTEEALKIWINGGWQNTLFPVIPTKNEAKQIVGALCMNNPTGYNNTLQIWSGTSWNFLQCIAMSIVQRASSYAWGTNNYIGFQDSKLRWYLNNTLYEAVTKDQITPQVVTFTDNTGETITANDTSKILVTDSFGAVSILDFSDIEKVEGKVIEISNLNGNTITMKDGATTLHLTNSNESVIKAICLSSVWHYYKVGSITEFT